MTITGVGRPLLFATGAAALVAGLTAGLQRLGWDITLPAPASDLAMVHGPLMVCGFFGTLIGLERAVALSRPWAFAAPLLTALGAITLLFGAAAPLMLAGSVAFLAGALVVVRRQTALYTVALALGAAAWVLGNAAWTITGEVPTAVAAWSCFLVLTIAGERLELSRFLPPSRWKAPAAIATFTVLLAGAALLAAGWTAGADVFGVGLLLLTAWLLTYDVVRRTIRQRGLTRFVAVSLASGYVWLAVAGLLCLAVGLPAAGPLYDAVLHSLFVGFVFAMVFGHVPVILPAVLRIALPYRPVFYLPLTLLHGSLVLRVAADLMDWDEVRRWGGALNVAAITAFVLVTLWSAAEARRKAAG